MKIEIERQMNASQEKLYAMWTDSKLVSSWFGVPVEIDPKVGGKLTINFGEAELTTGVYKELSPFSKVAFTWNSYSQGQPTGETLVTVTFASVAQNKTTMKLTHTGFKTEAARADHNAGWEDYFNSWAKKIDQ